jgi:hypothetical protein
VKGYEDQRNSLQPQVEELTRTLSSRSTELEALEQRLANAIAEGDKAASTGTFRATDDGSARGLTLTLSPDGSFDMESRNGQEVRGRYTLENDQLVFSDASGTVGGASFPMRCPISRTESGFSIGDAEGCLLAGVSFERR